jgi:tRNA (cytidine/uridine-2'-O-)-methyltransferase
VTGERLRLRAVAPPFRVVLVEPEIPQNTGNISRLCAATSTPLHLVGRLGFRIDEHAVRRAGLDYWDKVTLAVHPDLPAFQALHPASRLRLFSAKAPASYLDAGLAPGDALVFGRETDGLPDRILDAHPGAVFAIPTATEIRSLNLSNAVAIVLYEALRRSGSLDAARPGR